MHSAASRLIGPSPYGTSEKPGNTYFRADIRGTPNWNRPDIYLRNLGSGASLYHLRISSSPLTSILLFSHGVLQRGDSCLWTSHGLAKGHPLHSA